MTQSGKPEGLRRSSDSPPNWRLPTGVSDGGWDYIRSRQVASQYDDFVKNNTLIELDWRYILNYLPEDLQNLVIADFGTGSGRHAITLLAHGCRAVLGIDLSRAMLHEAIEKVREKMPHLREDQFLIPVWANLVELEGLPSQSVDFGICMFSTLGMISGSDNRVRFLRHAHRILKPGSRFILHVHNYWYQCRYPGGIRWMFRNWVRSFMGKSEIGDRLSDYRSIRNMFIHSFRYSELQRVLDTSGFEVREVLSLRGGNLEPKNGYHIADCFRTVGWILMCERTRGFEVRDQSRR
ncbi:MAG: class I SAM-dependent methyltransferase [Mariniblastus sp.]|nr:class I SAM-dependent methyltransferase [Mariniblastus sp.]